MTNSALKPPARGQELLGHITKYKLRTLQAPQALGA